MVSAEWTSLDDERAVAVALYGHDGAARMASWWELESSRVDDDAFAATFYEHVSLPGVANGDYLHRIVRTSHGGLLGGIRFRDRDVTRPFVEVIAHGFDDLDRLRACVRDEWSMFEPRHLRICTRPGLVTGPDALLDMTIHAAPYRDVRPPDPSVRLAPFATADEAITMVNERYERLAADDPALARNVTPAEPDDLRHWHDSGQLRAITYDGTPVGLLAVAAGSIRWIEGDEIQEEVVAADHRGHGYAVHAQAAWAACVGADPDRLLIGTIDGLNVASRTTALRAGRRRVLDRAFLAL